MGCRDYRRGGHTLIAGIDRGKHRSAGPSPLHPCLNGSLERAPDARRRNPSFGPAVRDLSEDRHDPEGRRDYDNRHKESAQLHSTVTRLENE